MPHNIHRRVAISNVLILLLSLLLTVTTIVTGFPNGAGGCDGGMAAVGGTHLGGDGRPVSNNTLLSGGVNVIIGNTTLDTNIPLDVSISMNHTITIISTQFPIRGILIRLQAPDGVDTTNILTPGLLLQDAEACVAPIVGTTHIDNSDKTEVSSTILFEEIVDAVYLDITGVFLNGVSGSVYVYSRYVVNFVSDVTPSSPAPTQSPIIVETTLPTITPIAIETSSPTATPVAVVTASPTASPVEVVTASPTLMPVAVVTASPTASPMASETSLPTPPPTVTSPAPTTITPSITLAPSQPSEETESPVTTPTTKATLEPSLRGGMGNGMMMSKITSTPSTTKSPKIGKGMGMGMMTMKGEGKVKQEKEVMKKSKIEDEMIEKTHSMMKLSKDEKS
jgi:hypothetical protein